MNLEKPIISQKKCEHCSNWTNGEKAFCSYCGEILDDEFRRKRDELEQKEKLGSIFINYYKIKHSDTNLLLFFIEKIIQGGQAIVIGIIALVTFILLLLPG
jgi:predicted nucleic acid-binding Zn ribbon protein